MRSALSRGATCSLHSYLGLQALKVTKDRGDRGHPPLMLVFEQAILGLDIAFGFDLVPLCSVADIVNRHIVMLAPEICHGVEFPALPQHIQRCGLALPFSNHPVLHADIFA